MKYFLKPLVALCLLTIVACSQESTTDPTVRDQAARLFPQDQDLAKIYLRSCRSCHAVSATGAPLSGDVAAWKPRMAKGMDTLVDNVINGFAGMPPYGLCMDCQPVEFEALINFMAGVEE